MLSERLKFYTKSNHQSLEGIVMDRINAICTKQDYVLLLKTFYRFVGSFEKAVRDHLDYSLLEDYSRRTKIDYIISDLTWLGKSLHSFSETTFITKIQSSPDALGALYVLEGSTLGGKIISKIIREKLNFSNNSGLLYFNCYNDQTMDMWRKFKEFLDIQVFTAAQENVIIRSANHTFLKFAELFNP